MPIPASGTGLLGPHTPAAALLSLTCPCSPSVRRSDRRSYFLHGVLLGDVTSAALIFRYDILSVLLRRALPVILTVSRCFDTYRWTSRSRRPLARAHVKGGPFGPSAAHAPTPGPHAGRSGQPQLKPRAAPDPTAHRTGSLRLAALSPPHPAPRPTTLTTPPAHPARTPSNPPAPPDMSVPAAAEPPRCPHRSIGDFGDVNL